jgi:NAD(P)-dependent dehydrogenase (short-subunit alcohol dehydrogenase family)
VSGLARAAASALDTALDRTVVPGFSRIGHAVRRRLPTWPDDPASGALAGRHVAVTGASSGLGRRTALDLAGLGATVHLVVRDADRGGRVAAEVEAAVGRDGAARVWLCDVSDLDSVRAFCAAFLESGVPLRALVHNAGALPPTRTTSAQGHESTMALHVLGPVLMTELLLPSLVADAGRVVFVTSGGMYTQALPVLDPDFEQGTYSGSVAYARSKRGQVELLPVLARRWATASGVSVHATHPGWASTPGVVTSLPRFAATMRPVLRTDTAGTDTTTWLVATEPAPASGLLWHDRRARPTSVLGRTRPTAEERELFWQWVAGATGLTE